MTTSKENPWDLQDKFVYESPDGGHTVYKRKIGSTDRYLTSDSADRIGEIVVELKEAAEWEEIRQAAQTNAVLQDMLNQIREYYYLTKSGE